MNANEALITHFYECFQKKDYKGMQSCYANNAIFNDAVFRNLNAEQVNAMWEMLCKKGKDLKLEFSNVKANENKGSVDWVASYTFSSTGKKVINRIKAEFEFSKGKIVKHTDNFSFYKWSSQALGLPGQLLGWTMFLKQKIRHKAANNLQAFMKKK